MAQPLRERFGRYELVSKLGRGGMAETWRARLLGAAGVTKPVLIKKVLAEYANDDSFVAMFISEARISATLSHGNIAQVFDFGRVEGDYFLAMEFVDGQPLDRVMKRARKSGLTGLPPPLASFIVLEMCKGLHYAHTRRDDKGAPLGIVHRDISPDNVLLSYEGQVKIVDFGIAKARALRNFQTEPGVVKGKYLFFSPEQAKGQEVDARTDVWAMGVVLYELLCGQLPVSGPAYTAMPLLARGEFPSPRTLRPELPEELDGIVMRALAVDKEARSGPVALGRERTGREGGAPSGCPDGGTARSGVSPAPLARPGGLAGGGGRGRTDLRPPALSASAPALIRCASTGGSRGVGPWRTSARSGPSAPRGGHAPGPGPRQRGRGPE